MHQNDITTQLNSVCTMDAGVNTYSPIQWCDAHWKWSMPVIWS